MLWVQPQEKRKEFATIYAADNTPVEKELVKRGLTLTKGPILCPVHKEHMEQQPSDLERRFVFVGAIPA